MYHDHNDEEEFNIINLSHSMNYYLDGNTDEHFDQWIDYISCNVDKYGTAFFDEFLERISKKSGKWVGLYDSIMWVHNDARQYDQISNYENQCSSNKLDLFEVQSDLLDVEINVNDNEVECITLYPSLNDHYRIRVQTKKKWTGINRTRYVGIFSFGSLLKFLKGELSNKDLLKLLETSCKFIYENDLNENIKKENEIISKVVISILSKHKESLLKNI